MERTGIRMAGLLPAVARGALAREQRKSMKRPVPTRPIYQALTHLDRCNALIYQDILLDHTDRSRRPLLTVTFDSQDAGLAKRRNRRRASSVLPSPLFNTAESGSAMQSEILETCLQDGFMQNRYPAREEVCRNIR